MALNTNDSSSPQCNYHNQTRTRYSGDKRLVAASMAPDSIRTGHQGIYLRTCSDARDRRLLPGHDPPSGEHPRH